MTESLLSHEQLRRQWEERYATFSLDESMCFGAGEQLNRLIYRCKAHALRKALGALRISRGSRFDVLDMGCGPGYFAEFYRDSYRAASYVGVDISDRAVDHARLTIPAFEFYQGDVVTWRHPAARRFDVIQSIDVLQLLTDDQEFQRAIRNLSEQLAEGGALILPLAFSTPPVKTSSQSFRSPAFFDDLLSVLGLRVVATFRMYYWLVNGGPKPSNRFLRAVFFRTGPMSLYLIDRLALRLGLRNRNPDQILSTAHMMVIGR